MKKKHRYPCPMCACTQTRTLSDEAAIEIHEFLEVFAANFLSQYGQRIYRHYVKQAKRKTASIALLTQFCLESLS